PSIVFFDELDSVVPRRGMGFGDSGVSERVISQLLTELDGIESLVNVVVIGATNRPDIIDPAVLRPGRFDRLIYVPAPDHLTRLNILKIHTRNMPLARDVDLEQISSQAAGYSGADLEAVCREAGLISLRRDMDTKSVTIEDFRDGLERVKPSVTPDMENWYQSFTKRFKKERAPVPIT
ncbi:AAA family ATPase, partial [Candidatus Bathyarchaeota archaeon]